MVSRLFFALSHLFDEGVDNLKKEVELYNDIYKEISEIVGF